MKVWIINHYAIPPSLGGLVRHYYFSKYLQEKGHEVKIFTASKIHNTDVNMIADKKSYIEKDMDGVTYTFVRTSDYKGNGIDRIINMLQFPIRIWSVCRKFEKPDVIYTSSPDIFTAVSAVLMAKCLKVKKVVEVRDLWPESIVEFSGFSRKNPIIQILYQMEKWLYRNADELIFTMAGGKQYIKDKGWTRGINPKKIHQINNGVDLKEFEYNKEHFQIQDEDLENEETFKVIYTGSIRSANNVETLVKAVEKLDEPERCQLLLYGDGTDKERLEQYCKKHKLSNVKFKGKVEKKYIPYILSKSDLNIINYRQTGLFRYGGSQNKLFEYFASGKPICSNVQMGYSLIEKYHCGIEKDISSDKEYADLIRTFMDMTSEEYALYLQNSRRIAEKHDFKVLTDKLEKILEDTEK